VATLSYDYSNRDVWLDPLAVEDDPAHHDLCERHAERVTVPHGWELHDRRAPAALLWQARAS
jgi:hypothetical protein